jgi:hypothetical protein
MNVILSHLKSFQELLRHAKLLLGAFRWNFWRILRSIPYPWDINISSHENALAPNVIQLAGSLNLQRIESNMDCLLQVQYYLNLRGPMWTCTLRRTLSYPPHTEWYMVYSQLCVQALAGPIETSAWGQNVSIRWGLHQLWSKVFLL